MHVNTISKLFGLAVLWLGVIMVLRGSIIIYDSGYTPPETPSGWIMGMFWISFGGVIAVTWFVAISARVVDQKCSGKPRWSVLKILSTSLPLLGSACIAITGTFVVWKHPYRLGPCDCESTQWGPNCLPCECGDHGLCDSGTYGSGICACDFGWAGDKCDRCGDRWKGEDCDVCKTGYANPPKCDRCARGYTGDECDICADGWRPWQNYSDLFPEVISRDDHRHLCDECESNHYGYWCKSCPIGNDVPQITLEKNNPITQSSRVEDSHGNYGHVNSMRVYRHGSWTETFDYDVFNPKVLTQTQIKIKYDRDRSISDWIDIGTIRGVQCNNRGVCNDDTKHQRDTPNWSETCTPSSSSLCTSNEDCLVSENCKGTCQATELPISAIWAIQLPEGKLCTSDEDCIDRSIIIDDDGSTYEGGRCMSRVCCKESYHGDGKCDCDPQFFGRIEEDKPFRHYKTSPACDFCPGYDWTTEEPSSICSGGLGTCTPGYSRSEDYLQMRCTCGQTQSIDPITKKIVPDKYIQWSGPLCECGDMNDDQKCDTCASGHWGPECAQCPGGFGLKACSGHGKCSGSGSNGGTGRCDCDFDENSNAWMLAPFVPRYPSETIGRDIDGNDSTCSECAPNFWGETCQRCFPRPLSFIKSSELENIFQPVDSLSFGIGVSSTQPAPLCHPQKPWLCSLACGGGGWCNWGRTGDGSCMCWSNKAQNPNTWNPLDNVCISNDRYDGALEDYVGIGEQCPAYGRCTLGENSRETKDLCGFTTNGWSPQTPVQDSSVYDSDCSPNLGTCFPWQQMDWREKNSGISCTRDE